MAAMNFIGSPDVIGISAMARDVTGRRPLGSGRSRNCSVQEAVGGSSSSVRGMMELLGITGCFLGDQYLRVGINRDISNAYRNSTLILHYKISVGLLLLASRFGVLHGITFVSVLNLANEL